MEGGEDCWHPIAAFFARYPDETAHLAKLAREMIQDVMPDALEMLDESANLIGYGIDHTYKGLICGITIHRSHINLMFAEGSSLPDPFKILAGTGKRARHIRITEPADLDSPPVRALLESALQMKRSNSTPRSG